MREIVQAISLLTPFDIDVPKIRLGPPTDGGYILADCLDQAQSVLSYVISVEYRFDIDMAARGHQVFMFDHTIDGINVVHPNMHYFKQGVAGETDPAALLYSVNAHLQMHQIAGERLILKMDVEGAEFEALIAMPDDVLGRFEQIVFEVHGLGHLGDAGFRARFCRLFEKLNRQFTLFHVHANNHDGPFAYVVAGGVPIPVLLELSYIKTDRVRRRASQTLYPTDLDYPNVDQRDKLLWSYPFMPTIAPAEAFSRCLHRLDEQDRARRADALAS